MALLNTDHSLGSVVILLPLTILGIAHIVPAVIGPEDQLW